MLLAEIDLVQIPFPKILIGAAIATAIILALNALTIFSTNRKVSNRVGRNWISRTSYLLFLVVVAVLAITSFASILQFGHMSGYALLAHVAAAGAFVFLLLAVAFHYLPRGDNPRDELITGDRRWWFARWSAWLMVFSSIAAAGTMFLSMLPILDTEGLLQMAALHRYAGVLVVACALCHVYALVCTKLGVR